MFFFFNTSFYTDLFRVKSYYRSLNFFFLVLHIKFIILPEIVSLRTSLLDTLEKLEKTDFFKNKKIKNTLI